MKINNYNDELERLELKDVIDIEFLQKFQDDFSEAMGLASVTVDTEGEPVTRPSNYTRFCKDFTHSVAKGDHRCAESHRKGGEEAARTGKPVIYECHAGLIDFAAPIMLEGRLIGTILGGQVLTSSPVEQKYQRIAKEIGVDSEGYVEAVREVTILSKQKIQAAANVLYIVTNNISQTCYQQRKLRNASSILKDSFNQMSAAMQEIASSAVEVNSNQQRLNKEIEQVDSLAKQIREVTDFINRIVNETKILGLNASIEAARVGEAGRGFGVVAKEISKLSNESKEMIVKINDFLKLIQESVKGTVNMGGVTLAETEQQSAAIQEMTASIEEITGLAQQLYDLAVAG